MDKNIVKNAKKERRRGKIRAKISGTSERPRLSVFRSNTGLFLQIVNDNEQKTLVSANSKEIKVKKSETKVDVAFQLGKLIGERAIEKKISKVVFDRGGNQFHGRVKAVADGAREAGLSF